MRMDVVGTARDWIGTPYRHQASVRGAGCDCLGLIRGVWRSLYGEEPEVPPPYTPDWSEPQGQEMLWQAAMRHLVAAPLNAAQPGDVLLFRLRDGWVAKHLAIQTQVGAQPRIVHAYARHGVVESPLTPAWSRRIVGRFRFPPLVCVSSPLEGG